MPPLDPSADAATLRTAAETLGLSWRGAFHPDPADGVPPFADGAPTRTLVLLGFTGHAQWRVFAASPEYADGAPHPLDRWSRRVLSALAAACEGNALFPFQGPPWLPFLRWAQRAESLKPSPLGLLVHPEFGLWHAYRGALGLRTRLDLTEAPPAPRPCDSCVTQPCLRACPVGAFAAGRYDRDRCVQHVRSPAGRDCLTQSCRARRACPVGEAHRYAREQSEFHMRALIGRVE